MNRSIEPIVAEHFRENRQMLFLMGPRQVGKTTTARAAATHFAASRYLSWDNLEDRQQILMGPRALAQVIGLDQLRDAAPLCVLDELHKYGRWKTFLKGFFDTYERDVRVLVTGSARLDVFRAGEDSLMGRYFGYRMHPLSVGECRSPQLTHGLIRPPAAIDQAAFDALVRFGGYPEPFLKASDRFWRRWSRTRRDQLLREDLRDLTRVRELGQVEVLAELLRQQCGQLTNTASLSRRIGASVDSVRRWLHTLASLYYCFALRPWHRNVARSLRKEPKFYLWDWSQAPTPGARAENMVASALLKAVQQWTDRGLGDFGLFFLRDKDKREVDFLVVHDGDPWFLVEVKATGAGPLSPALRRFQAQTGARHAFQLALDLPYVDRDCFEHSAPIVVPARTLLSQLP